MLFLSACGNKLAFKEQPALEKGSLVYIYIPESLSTDESLHQSNYLIRINGKRYSQRVMQGEYVVLKLKANPTKISATQQEIMEKSLDLNLENSKIYYLRIRDDLDNGEFSFERVSDAKGLKEISKTGLAGSNEESPSNIITEFINPDDENQTQTQQKQETKPVSKSSKTQEIQKAYEMKEKGIITDEEFKALKSDIMSK